VLAERWQTTLEYAKDTISAPLDPGEFVSDLRHPSQASALAHNAGKSRRSVCLALQSPPSYAGDTVRALDEYGSFFDHSRRS